MTGLHGWDAGAAWEDVKFVIKHFSDIDRLAMVGDKKWEHGMATLFQPFTKTTSDTSIKPTPKRHKWLVES